MKSLKLYFIYDKYIDYLRKFDKRVPYNKNKKRPYIGIVYEYNGINYFAPLSSPKKKHLKIRQNAVDVFKIDDGKLGVININNMVPTPLECLTDVFSNFNGNEEYRSLLFNQLKKINNDRERLFKKIIRFQTEYRKGCFSDTILNRCCNFLLLEEKCALYSKDNFWLYFNVIISLNVYYFINSLL